MLPSAENEDKIIGEKAEIENQANMLRAQLHLPEGQWYPATIISAVLTPQPGLDEELIFETIAFLIPPLIELIQENGCQVLRHQDGITAIFGAPITHEDDAERAIDSAIQIVNFYNELDQQTELPISIHLGASMGKVVAGKVGMGHSAEFMAAGEPVQLARIIAEACPSGRVWVTQSIRNHTYYRFEYTPVPSDMVESLPKNTTFQLEGLREQILPVRGLIGLKSPFIGRDKELDEMERMSQVLKGETVGIIWIEGEAGIGERRDLRSVGRDAPSRLPALQIDAFGQAQIHQQMFARGILRSDLFEFHDAVAFARDTVLPAFGQLLANRGNTLAAQIQAAMGAGAGTGAVVSAATTPSAAASARWWSCCRVPAASAGGQSSAKRNINRWSIR